MKTGLILIITIFGTCVSVKVGWRIVGGYDAEVGEYPFHVSLKIHGKHECSGSIIHPKVILTAAHCVYQKNASDIVILTGSNFLDRGGQLYDVIDIKHHDNYNSTIVRHDVALLKLARPIVFDKFTKPIRLDTTYVGENMDCLLSGFGLNGFPEGNVTNELQHVQLTTISYSLCKQLLSPSPVFPTQLCTLTKKGVGTCKGDSGGPLMRNGKQIGIVSWGRSCALGYPDVFTRLSSYFNWILFNI
ncbi:hypothetical protein FQR65_LT02149 [Abscondita terminalis]|nr:hypothetical protein FQR65_LT02149 [Abscondita terminalis]